MPPGWLTRPVLNHGLEQTARRSGAPANLAHAQRLVTGFLDDLLEPHHDSGVTSDRDTIWLESASLAQPRDCLQNGITQRGARRLTLEKFGLLVELPQNCLVLRDEALPRSTRCDTPSPCPGRGRRTEGQIQFRCLGKQSRLKGKGLNMCRCSATHRGAVTLPHHRQIVAVSVIAIDGALRTEQVPDAKIADTLAKRQDACLIDFQTSEHDSVEHEVAKSPTELRPRIGDQLASGTRNGLTQFLFTGSCSSTIEVHRPDRSSANDRRSLLRAVVPSIILPSLAAQGAEIFLHFEHNMACEPVEFGKSDCRVRQSRCQCGLSGSWTTTPAKIWDDGTPRPRCTTEYCRPRNVVLLEPG